MSKRDAHPPLSTIEREFVVQALHAKTRGDGRKPFQTRKTVITLHRTERTTRANVEVGDTRVTAVVSAELVPPYPDRPTEGFLHVSMELSPMSSPEFEGGRPSVRAVELSRALERALRDSRAVDTEALCVVAGQRVWDVRVDVRVLNHAGNLEDAGTLAAVAALRCFRRPQVSVLSPGGGVEVHALSERQGVPLSIHHVPLSVTFALVEYAVTAEGAVTTAVHGAGVTARHCGVLLDPTDREELVASGSITITLTPHREVCAVHKLGGAALAEGEVMRCVQVAAARAEELGGQLQQVLQATDEAEAARNYVRPATAAHMRALGGGAPIAGTFTAHLAGEVEAQPAELELQRSQLMESTAAHARAE